MRRTLLGLVVATLATVPIFTPSAGASTFKPTADPYKWCAVFSGSMAGGPNCGFITREQCLATVSGIGGFCRENLWYTGPEAAAPRAHKHHKHKAS